MALILKQFFLFLVGGTTYYFLEIIFRGYSHFSMFILGGICFVIIGSLDEGKNGKIPIVLQMGISAIIITILEFVTGMIVNVKLQMNVWDYSALPLNIMGQVCVLYTVLWFFLSYFAIILDNYLRAKFF